VLIVLAVLVVIGAVAVGVIRYLRKKKANAGGAGQMNANNAAAGASDQPGTVSGGQTESAAGAELLRELLVKVRRVSSSLERRD
jgi:hypothetical protein